MFDSYGAFFMSNYLRVVHTHICVYFYSIAPQFGEPKVMVTDKAPSIGAAFKKLQKNGLYIKTEH